jgi:magnesium chelatase family protein
VSRHQKRVSGPLLDRIDIFVEVPPVEYEKLAADSLGEPSAAVRERVQASRARQEQRFSGSRIVCNAEMSPTEVREHCQSRVGESAQSLLRLAMTQLSFSPRAFHRVLKLARAIADLVGQEELASRTWRRRASTGTGAGPEGVAGGPCQGLPLGLR